MAVNSFLVQLQELGFLVHWESLLSTHKEEIGMLEDFIVAIHDLNTLKFKVHLIAFHFDRYLIMPSWSMGKNPIDHWRLFLHKLGGGSGFLEL